MTSPGSSTVGYLSHWFPALSERYVPRQIEAIRARGIGVLVIAVKRPEPSATLAEATRYADECVYLTPLRAGPLLLALVDCFRFANRLSDIYARVMWGGPETISRRAKALLHTWLGAYLARVLAGRATHLHANHGYFPAWAAMITSRLTGIPYSLTLHGSDLLVDQVYLDLKTTNATFVVTISDFNKRFLLETVPALSPERVVVNRLGVDSREESPAGRPERTPGEPLVLLTVGRLHPVKNQQFLLRACRQLIDGGKDVICRIVGDGPERKSLAELAARLGLSDRVTFLGSLPPAEVAREYLTADLFVLTSRSEGLPIVLIEAMSHGLPVVAPAITGIPELVTDGATGFLYHPDDLTGVVAKIAAVASLSATDRLLLCQRAQGRVSADYDGPANTEAFAKLFDGPPPSHPTAAEHGR